MRWYPIESSNGHVQHTFLPRQLAYTMLSTDVPPLTYKVFLPSLGSHGFREKGKMTPNSVPQSFKRSPSENNQKYSRCFLTVNFGRILNKILLKLQYVIEINNAIIAFYQFKSQNNHVSYLKKKKKKLQAQKQRQKKMLYPKRPAKD